MTETAAGIPVTGVSELVLEVADLDAAERFYARALGLPVVERWPDRGAIWVLAGDRTRIGLWRPQVGVAGGRGGVHVHFALHLDDDAFDAAVGRLREWNLRPQVEERGGSERTGDRSVYVDDPDGNCVELWTQDVSRYAPESEDGRWTAHFDATASTWDAEYGAATVRGHWWRVRADAVARLVGEGPGSLLDIGAGSGRIVAALAARGWAVTGVDPSARMIELARARVPSEEVQLVVARAEDLPFGDDAFDVVIAVGVFEYAQLGAAVRELVRVLKPRGRAVVVLRRRSPTIAWQLALVHPAARALKHVRRFGRALPRTRPAPLPENRARELLSSAGLVVERVENVGCAVLPDPLDYAAPRLAYRTARSAERAALLRRALGTQRILVARKP